MTQDEQNRVIARTIYRDVAPYAKENPKAYAAFLSKKRRAECLVSLRNKGDMDIERPKQV